MYSFEIITPYFTQVIQADDIETAKTIFERDFPDEEILEILPLD